MNITRQMIAAVLICAGGELAAKTLTVDANGGAEFTSIDAAVAVAEPGDTVRVMPGLYRETVVVRRGGTKDRPIVIESAVRGKPYPGPDADVRPGPFVGFDWNDAGVQFALDPFERTTPPAIPVR